MQVTVNVGLVTSWIPLSSSYRSDIIHCSNPRYSQKKKHIRNHSLVIGAMVVMEYLSYVTTNL